LEKRAIPSNLNTNSVTNLLKVFQISLTLLLSPLGRGRGEGDVYKFIKGKHG
jgi:hypothetical protein